MKFSYVRWTDHPCFMGDVWNVHNLQLTYGTYASNGRCMEHSRFTVDVQGMPALGRWSEPQNQQSTDKNYISVIGINFPTPSPTT